MVLEVNLALHHVMSQCHKCAERVNCILNALKRDMLGTCTGAARLLDVVDAVDHAIAAQVVPGQAVGAHLQRAHMRGPRLTRGYSTCTYRQLGTLSSRISGS